MAEVRNVVVYMVDGLRWDHHPQAVHELGTTFRTIASSLHTPTAIASMLTGQYLPSHDIRGFTDTLGENQQTILDGFPNRSLSPVPGDFNTTVYGNLLGRFPRGELSAIDEPFAWFMRDAGGHAPYDRFDEHLQTDESVQSYLQQHGGNVSRIRSDYADAVGSSVKRFRRFVLKPLEERGLRDQTLIVFVSDHGQLLGEYGHVGESYPSAPEVVKIPTTLIHPDLPTGEQASQLMRHVDLPPVVAGLVDPKCPVGAVDGEDVRSTENSPEMGLNYYDRLFPSVVGQFNYAIESVWDWKGGHAFLESPMWNRLKLFAGFVTQIPAGIHFRRERSLEGLKLLFQSEQTWGDPGFTVAEARKHLACFERTGNEQLQIDAETQDRLEDLGYL